MEIDDVFSDYFGVIFYIKDIDSEKEDDRSLKLDSVKLKIVIKYVVFNKVFFFFIIKELIIRRESFRR